jgi:hypothetical protein
MHPDIYVIARPSVGSSNSPEAGIFSWHKGSAHRHDCKQTDLSQIRALSCLECKSLTPK